MKKTIFALLTSLVAASAMADDIRLGTPQYGGTGCPAGTASVALSPDAKSLSILFDQYVTESGGSTGRTSDRKSCNVAIPVHVPQGFSVSVFAIDYRGYNNLPAGASSRFNVEYFFAGQRGPTYSRNFSGPQDNGNYTLTNTLQATAIVWSACGQDVILRTNTSMQNQTNWRREQTTSTVDSIDVDAGIIYQLQWKRC